MNCLVRAFVLLLGCGLLLANPALDTPASPSRSTRLRFEVRAKPGLLGNPLDGRLLDVLELRMRAWIEGEKGN